MKRNYEHESKNLAEAIDIAVKAIKKFPPKGASSDQIEHFIETYLDFKSHALNPEKKYKNLKSLDYLINDVFIYFQEAGGKDVDYFWEEIKRRNLPYKRVNKMTKILKRGRIRNRIEYDFVIDVIVPYQQEGLIDENGARVLEKMLEIFINKNIK